jgi:hypothetical protein
MLQQSLNGHAAKAFSVTLGQELLKSSQKLNL